MNKWLVRAVIAAVAMLVIAATGFFLIAPVWIDARLNRVVADGPHEVGREAAALHATLRVADLHSDLLMTARDPLKRYRRGHTDAPRLVEGGFRLQVFSAVTKAPRGINYEKNASDSDAMTPLFIAMRWPRRTWSSLAERALYQGEKLARAAAGSDGGLVVVRTRSDLEQALSAGALAGVLALEGAHPLEGDLENLDRLFEGGYRVMGLQHFFDNELGGSLHGMSGGGLTEFGTDAVAEAERRGVIIDLAHSSEATVRDVLAMATRPAIVSHTGLRGHCDSPRNIPDDLVKEIAARGGLIGVGFWDAAVCEPTPAAIAKAIAYAVGLVGAEHVALGSDFDGATTVPFDAAGIAVLTEALMKEGLDEATIRLVMGENVIRFFLENLPPD